MERKFLYLGASFLMIVALVLASCGGTAEEGEQEEEEGIATLSIGETCQTSDFAVTISAATITNSYEYYDEAAATTTIVEAEPGTSFLIITVELENVGTRRLTKEGAHRFRAFDFEGNEYLHDAAYQGENRVVVVNVDPGQEMKGTVLIDIPEGVTGLKATYGRMVSGDWRIFAQWEIN